MCDFRRRGRRRCSHHGAVANHHRTVECWRLGIACRKQCLAGDASHPGNTRNTRNASDPGNACHSCNAGRSGERILTRLRPPTRQELHWELFFWALTFTPATRLTKKSESFRSKQPIDPSRAWCTELQQAMRSIPTIEESGHDKAFKLKRTHQRDQPPENRVLVHSSRVAFSGHLSGHGKRAR